MSLRSFFAVLFVVSAVVFSGVACSDDGDPGNNEADSSTSLPSDASSIDANVADAAPTTDAPPATGDGSPFNFLDGGFSVDLMHHAMHVMGSRMLGFSQELFDDAASMPAAEAAEAWSQMADVYPNIAKLIPVAMDTHEGPVVGTGCDDQFEFEFALDLVLDGLERLRAQG